MSVLALAVLRGENLQASGLCKKFRGGEGRQGGPVHPEAEEYRDRIAPEKLEYAEMPNRPVSPQRSFLSTSATPRSHGPPPPPRLLSRT